MPAEAGGRFGRFTLDTPLGAGAYGEVWKAWAPDIGRWVALKLLKAAGGDEQARFEREAKTAAKLDHPGVVRIFEVGEVDGRPYLSMEYVEGGSLEKRTFAPREAARILRDAAVAVHAAHEAGLVHRDLKPHNLLLDAEGRVRVTDFGLARPVEGGSTLTATGMMVGTPAYMSPEQARGETRSIDARSDVYGLGATLYHLLTGRPPFEGADLLSVVLHLIEDEPAPLPPSVPGALRSIVAACLQKRAEDRYPSAAALAEDLDRFLRGEAPSASTFRTLPRTTRRKLWTTAAAAAVVVIAIGSVLALRAAGGRAESASEQLLREMRRTSETCLQTAFELRRTGNLRGMEEQAARLEEVCARVEKAMPALAEPHVLRGRMHRARMDDRRALEAQKRALELDPENGRARYERIVLTYGRFADRWEGLKREAWRRLGERLLSGERDPVVAMDWKPLEPIGRELEADLAVLEGRPEAVEPDELACARALAAITRRDVATAGRLLESAGTTLPEVVVARVGMLRWGQEAGTRRAIEVLTEAIERDRGFVRFLAVRAECYRDLCLAAGGRDEPAKEDAAALLADARRITELVPGDARGWLLIAFALAEAGDSRGALDAVDRAVAVDPDGHEAFKERGQIRSNVAVEEQTAGRDPTALYEGAIADASRAIELDGTCAMSWSMRAVARLNLAYYGRSTGRDVTRLFEMAMEDCTTAVTLEPKQEMFWVQRAELRIALAAGASEPFRLAIEDFTRGVDARKTTEPLWRRGNGYLLWSGAVADEGGDPVPYLRKALEDGGRAIAEGPKGWEGWWIRGQARFQLAMLERDFAQQEKGLKAAADDEMKAAELGPTQTKPLIVLAQIRDMWAEGLSRQGRDPSVPLSQAERDMDRALKLNARDPEIWELRGIVRMDQGAHEAAAGRDPGPRWRAALADFAKSLDLHPNRASALRYTGHLYYRWAVWKQKRGESLVEEARKGVEAYSKAIRADRNLAEELTKYIEWLERCLKE